MKQRRMKGEIAVAMSGGVDSAVAASLLIKDGFAVRGFFMNMKPSKFVNNFKSFEQERAEEVALKLGVPLEILNYQDFFQEKIIEGYLLALGQGLTPNPCVMCNQLIKWGKLLEYVQSEGIDLLASGHYAFLKKEINGNVDLYKGKDETKDQSYVLSSLPQSVLQQMILPLGELQKKEVRILAQEFGLAKSVDSESQDLCFLEGYSQDQYLKQKAPWLLQPGEITDQNGKVLGQHFGLVLYTIGQRKGLGIAWSEPLYVIEKNLEHNKLIVGTTDTLNHNVLIAKNANWISELPKYDDSRYEVKIRYKAKLAKARIQLQQDSKFTVIFDECLRDITPGQRVVIYKGQKCLGGGEIIKALNGNSFEEVRL